MDTVTRRVMAALQGGEKEPQALFVGGCVRNALMGRAVDDIDIATLHAPPETTKQLEAAGIRVIPTGIDHGTVTAVLEGKSFEITTLRKDVETDGRHAVVAFSKDWREDAQRRDFTLNTLLLDEAGNVYDPTGQGLGDLKAHRVVFVGDPAQRIAEDYLRILRFFRFYGTYGRGAPDAPALKACAAAASKIETLSKERITHEFFKILALDNAGDILGIMFDNQILDAFSSNFSKQHLTRLCNLQKKSGLEFLPSRLFLLSGLEKNNLSPFDKFLLFPKIFLKEIEEISKALKMDLSLDHGIKTALYKHGRHATLQALLIRAAKEGVEPNLKLAQEWEIPVLPISGDDLIKKGMRPGPELGRELARLEAEWIARGFK